MPVFWGKMSAIIFGGVFSIAVGEEGIFSALCACVAFVSAQTSFRGLIPNLSSTTKIKCPNGHLIFVAETKGFEPLIPLRVYHISNVAH